MIADSQIPVEGHSRLKGQLEHSGLPPHLIDEFMSHHTLVRYPKDAPIFLQGSPADVAFGVLAGLVKVYCPNPGGGRTLVELAGPGDFIGCADFVDPRSRRVQIFEARAATKAAVALFTRAHALKLLHALDPGSLVQFLEAANTRLSASIHRWTAFLRLSFRERLELALSELGQRFGAPDARGTMITPELGHEDLAEMIGSSRPMVTRIMAELAGEKMIVRHGRQYILLKGAGLDAVRLPFTAHAEPNNGNGHSRGHDNRGPSRPTA